MGRGSERGKLIPLSRTASEYEVHYTCSELGMTARHRDQKVMIKIYKIVQQFPDLEQTALAAYALVRQCTADVEWC